MLTNVLSKKHRNQLIFDISMDGKMMFILAWVPIESLDPNWVF